MNKEVSLYRIDNRFFSAPMDFGDFSIVQIGRRYCAPGEIIEPHLHRDWFEITIVLNGAAEVISNGKSHTVKKGDIYCSLPYEIHEISASSEEALEYDFFSFICKGGMMLNEFESIMQGMTDEKHRIFRDERIEFLIGNAILECSEDHFGKDLVLKDSIQQVLIYLIRFFKGISEEKGKKSKPELLCYKVMNYIDTHLYSLEEVGQLSEIFNYDKSYLSSTFRKITGKTIFDYFSSRRLERAKFLVLEGNMKIWEIAEILHYSSAFSFSKAFTSKYGISPKKMQQQSLQKPQKRVQNEENANNS